MTTIVFLVQIINSVQMTVMKIIIPLRTSIRFSKTKMPIVYYTYIHVIEILSGNVLISMKGTTGSILSIYFQHMTDAMWKLVV